MDDQRKNDSINEIKDSLENLLKTKVSLTQKRKTKEDEEFKLFEKIIFSIEELDARGFMLEENVSLDLSKYDNLFYNVIEDLLLLHFGPEVLKVINFYLYDRYRQDGTVVALIGKNNKVIPLQNTSDLWNLIKVVKSQNKK